MILPSSQEKDSDNSHVWVVVQDDATTPDGALGNLDAPHGYVGYHYSCLLCVRSCVVRLNAMDVRGSNERQTRPSWSGSGDVLCG